MKPKRVRRIERRIKNCETVMARDMVGACGHSYRSMRLQVRACELLAVLTLVVCLILGWLALGMASRAERRVRAVVERIERGEARRE